MDMVILIWPPWSQLNMVTWVKHSKKQNKTKSHIRYGTHFFVKISNSQENGNRKLFQLKMPMRKVKTVVMFKNAWYIFHNTFSKQCLIYLIRYPKTYSKLDKKDINNEQSRIFLAFPVNKWNILSTLWIPAMVFLSKTSFQISINLCHYYSIPGEWKEPNCCITWIGTSAS